MHLAPLIRDLALILAVASIVAFVFQRIRQPVVLGYIFAGLIIGPYASPIPLVSDQPNIRIWAELGVIFLMFSLGLEFSFRKLSRIGLSAAMTAAFEIPFMLFLGFLTGLAMGWSFGDCVFLAAIIAISSTTIIVKALDEMGLKTRRFSESIFGVLIVEDLVAILILVALPAIALNHAVSGLLLLGTAGKLILVVGTWFLAGYFVVPRLVEYVGRHTSLEILTLSSVALCLCLAIFAAQFHYSVALGAFIMGSILAESTESHRIAERVIPLRDLFAAIFFVSVGMLIDPLTIFEHWKTILVVTIITVGGKIFAVSLGSLLSGKTLRTSIQIGFGMAQIGEFSFILAALGRSLNVTSDSLYAITVAVALITTLLTPLLIRRSHKIAVAVEESLPIAVRNALDRYASWALERETDRAFSARIYRHAFRFALNGLLVISIFTLTAALGVPWLLQQGWSHTAVEAAGWAVAAVLSSPFVWAMASSAETPPGRFIARLLTLFGCGLLSLELLPARVAVAITGAIAILLFIVFYRRLEASYHWLERNFLTTFKDRRKRRRSGDVLRELAPWDAHLVRLKVHPNAEIVSKTLADLRLRSQYGLSVVAIQRGLATIVAPRSNEHFYPKDELMVLGTDEQIDAFRPLVERPSGPSKQEQLQRQSDGGYELKPLFITANSPLASKSIRESEIRDRYGAMVVGIERKQHRMINPDSATMIQPMDRLWVVGPTDRIEKLWKDAQGTPTS